jgi:hypothetical protein
MFTRSNEISNKRVEAAMPTIEGATPGPGPDDPLTLPHRPPLGG